MTVAAEPRGPACELTLHASCIAMEGRGLLILGAAGSGKSTLALALMALGARLVADDRTELYCENAQLIARVPAVISGQIEARGIGILNADALVAAPIAAVIDLDKAESQRLPPERRIRLLDRELPLLHGPATPYLPSALVQYLKGGRHA